MDLVLVTESGLLISPTDPPLQICVMIVATDDQVVEGIESFSFIVTAGNPLDIISGNTTINITDNDGKIKTSLISYYLEYSLPLTRC